MSDDIMDVLNFSDGDNTLNDFEFSFDDLPDNEPLPEGIYLIEVVDATAKLSKNKSPMLALQVKVLSGNDVDEANLGSIIFDNLSFKNYKAKQISKQKLRGLGQVGFTGNLIELADNLKGMKANSKVGIAPASENSETGEEYPARNIIKSYSQVTGSIEDML